MVERRPRPEDLKSLELMDMDEEELRRSIDDIAHDRADMYTPPLDSPQVRTAVGRSSSSEAEASEASEGVAALEASSTFSTYLVRSVPNGRSYLPR